MTTNYPSGITNSATSSILGQLPILDPSKNHTYFNDFDSYNAAEWIVTETQAGATEAIADEDGGILLLTNTAADNDLVAMQLLNETYKFQSGKPLFFKARFKVSDAIQSDLVFGLQIKDTTPLSVTDGVYFSKVDGSATLDFQAVKNSVATIASAVTTLTNNTYIIVTFYYNGSDKIFYTASTSEDSLLGKGIVTTNLPDDEELTISFAIQNGEAVAKTMSIDYILVSKNRS